MSYPPPKRSVPASPQKPAADFHWPTEEELALAQFDGKTFASDASHANPVLLTETLAPPSAAAIEQAATPPSSSEPLHAEFDYTKNDVGPTGAEHLPTFRVAVAQNETAVDGASPGEWVAEIGRLQELIEGLTQKLEWRTAALTRVSHVRSRPHD